MNKIDSDLVSVVCIIMVPFIIFILIIALSHHAELETCKKYSDMGFSVRMSDDSPFASCLVSVRGVERPYHEWNFVYDLSEREVVSLG